MVRLSCIFTILLFSQSIPAMEFAKRLYTASFRVWKNHRQNSCNQLLMEAVADGNEEEIKALIKAGAQIDAEDDEGLTAFHRALLDNEPELAQLLVNLGAYINKPIGYHNCTYTPLMLLCNPWFFQQRCPDYPIASAQWLITRGIDINEVNSEGQTAFWLACNRYGANEDIVALLHMHGADINKPDNKGAPPLWNAFKHCDRPTLCYLLSEKADRSYITDERINTLDDSWGCHRVEKKLLRTAKHQIPLETQRAFINLCGQNIPLKLRKREIGKK